MKTARQKAIEFEKIVEEDGSVYYWLTRRVEGHAWTVRLVFKALELKFCDRRMLAKRLRRARDELLRAIAEWREKEAAV